MELSMDFLLLGRHWFFNQPYTIMIRYLIAMILCLPVPVRGYPAFSLIAETGQEKARIDSSRIYNNLGIASYREGDFEKAGVLFQKSLDKKKIEHGSFSIDMASTYSNLGTVNRKLGRSDDAMLYYDSAGYVYTTHYGPDHPLLGAVYQNQGNLLRDQRDINTALSYYNNALRIFLKHDRTDWIATLYNNIGIAYWMIGSFDDALEYYSRTIDLRKSIDPASIALPAGNMALCYMEKGNVFLAEKFYLMAIDAISKNLGINHPDLATNLLNYGLFLIKYEDNPEGGYEMMIRALEIYNSVYDGTGQFISRAFLYIGYFHEKNDELEKALEYYHKSLVANSETFTSENVNDNPSIDDHAFSFDYLLTSLKHKSFAQYLLSGIRDKKDYLVSSLATLELAVDVIEKIKMAHHTEESRILLAENEHETYMQAIHIAWKLYELTSAKEFLEEAFVFSERSKAASLLSSVRDIEARSFGGVDPGLLNDEQDIKRRISAYRELIYEEQKIAGADNEKISLWQERIFALELELRQLIGRLETEYPDYYALKYNTDVAGAGEIMAGMGSSDALVSYVASDSLVYIFTLTRKKAELFCVDSDTTSLVQLRKLLDVLTSGNMGRGVREDYANFINSSRYFYNLLVEPVIDEIKNKRLIIVPDGFITYVPFELLLSRGQTQDDLSYKKLPYLIRDFSVSYNFSATLWSESLQKRTSNSRRLLAMAPSYEYHEIPPPEIFQSRQYYRDKLMPLPGARDEAVSIAGMMKGDVLLDELATEVNFKNMAVDYRILHLAMHALLDDENPMFSKLVFAEPGCDEEDGFLNTHEIYNLRLDADLAVLSSCRSGYGILRRGEGVMSLARGFFYAGVPSIVMTNWEIEDKSGAEIMSNFYRYLLKGRRKDDALRMARLDFIENTDNLRAHPYFWGAYVCIGNPDEIFSSYRRFFAAGSISLLLLLVVAILWLTQSKK
jgi:CHAT domain-containing protein/Tfp pilus assembly protein PilF